METHISFLILLKKKNTKTWDRNCSSLPQHQSMTQLADVYTEMIQVCMSVSFAGHTFAWEPVKLTLIHALCAGGYPEDISITECTLVFRF